MPTAAGILRPPFSFGMAKSGTITAVSPPRGPGMTDKKNRRTGRGAAVGEAASMQERRLKTRTSKDADGTGRTVHGRHHAACSAEEPASPAVETVAKVGKKAGAHNRGFATGSSAHSRANPQRTHRHSMRAPNAHGLTQDGKHRGRRVPNNVRGDLHGGVHNSAGSGVAAGDSQPQERRPQETRLPPGQAPHFPATFRPLFSPPPEPHP